MSAVTQSLGLSSDIGQVGGAFELRKTLAFKAKSITTTRAAEDYLA